MSQYVVKRLLGTIPVLIGVSILIFVMVRMIPGDTATILAGEDATPETIQRIRESLGLDRPLIIQYLEWVGGMLVGDFGESQRTGLSVSAEIASRLPVTFQLTIMALSISLAISIPAGVISALYQDRAIDYAARLGSIIGLSIPNFWLGLMLLVLPVIWFGWAPRLVWVPIWEDPIRNLQLMMFPAIALGTAQAAIVTRMVRSSLLEVMRSDYIRTARAKGLRERRVMFQHALKNAFIPVITILGLQVGTLLGGSVVLERIYALPGLGRFAFEAIGQRDFLMLQTVVLVFAFFYAVVNLLVDLAYAWLDPRIRYD